MFKFNYPMRTVLERFFLSKSNPVIDGNLAVSGDATFEGEVTANDNVSIDADLEVTGAVTADSVEVDDVEITGTLTFGTPVAVDAETVTHYITINDAEGNPIKIAVVS